MNKVAASEPLDAHGRVLDVVISGTSAGIGRACAELFLARGHRVWGIDIANKSIAHEHYTHVCCDVRDIAGADVDVEPDVVVSNAGVQASGADIEVNLVGAMRFCEHFCWQEGHAAEALKSVVLVGSASGHTGSEFPAYAASKGGLMAYTKNLAQRLAPQAVCNSVDPGGVLTELNAPVTEDPALWERIMDLTPLKRWATPEEIAEWIYFVGVTNRFMTGQNLLIDGGEAGNFDFVWPEDS